MIDIRIKRLALENFKCHGHLVLELEGRNASVYGDNASGKTSIYDALTWLLFGKDSAGNGEKNIDIKPLDADGNVKDHLAETAVEAALQALSAELGKTDADLAKLAAKISDKVAKGDTRQVGRLYAAVQGAVERSNTTALTNKLIEKGYETQTARRVAQVLMEARSGEVTSQAQAELLAALRGDETVIAALSETLESEDSAGYRMEQQLRQMVRGQVASEIATPAVQVRNDNEGAQEVEAAEDDAAQTQEEAPEAAVQKAVESLNLDDKTTAALVQGYANSGLTSESYIKGVQDAYAYGQNRYSQEDLSTGANTAQLLANVRDTAYYFGRRAAIAQNQRRPHINGKPVTRVDSKGTPTRKRGFVKAYGVSVNELNKSFNDAQGHAYGILNRIAEITGIDIVLFKSKKDASGKLRGGIVEGIDMNDSQGAFSWHNDKIYIDVNAGVLTEKELGDVAKYSMLRTFSHEFTHFIEKHNPVEYANFRELVLETMRQNGYDPEAMIDAYMQQDKKLDREAASREVVAEAMTDILPESSFVEQLAQKHKNLFQTLLDKLKAFVDSIKDHFASIGYNRAEEAQALKRQEDGVVKYAEQIVAMFDKIAVQAVERYQEAQKAEKNTAQTDGEVQHQARKHKAQEYETSGVHWGVEAQLMTQSEARKIWEAIANIRKLGYYYPISVKGEHIISADNALFFVDADYRAPSVNKIVRFNEEYMVNAGYAKELIIDARGNPARHREALRDVADIYGEGFAVEYDRAVYEADARKNGGREGKNRGGSDNGTQRQRRTSTLTNRDILAETPDSAAQNDVERKYLRQYREQLDKVQEQEQKQRDLTEQLEALEDGQEEKHKDLQFELTRTKNRLDILSKKLKETENAKPMEDLVQREASRILTELRKEYGTIPQGEKAVRDDALPVSTDGKNRVSRTARSVKGAEVTPDEFAGMIDAKVAKGELTYLPISNDETTQNAMQYIQDEGWETAKTIWSKDVRQGKANAEMSAIGALLLNNAAQAGDREAWLEILADYRLMGTRAAQAVQALRILKTLEPSDQLWMVQKSVEKMVKDLHLEGEVQIDNSLIDEYNAATTDKQRDSVISKIQRDVAQQLPSTMMEMWTALRYVNMLGNLKTQGRNILGNVASLATHTVKDANAAILESIAAKLSKGEFKRTKSLTVSRDLLSACKADFADVESLALDGGKYADVATSRLEKGIRDQKRVFKAPASVKNEKTRRAINAALTPLEWYRKATSTAMEKGDLWFSRSAYAMSLAGYLKANGVKETDLSKVDAALLDEARAYAIREAQEVTFRDHNALTEILSSKFAETSVVAKAANAAAQGIMPFRQTPANVLLRAEEYSPLGIVNSLVLTFQAAMGKTTLAQKNGLLGDFAKAGQQITGAQLINSFAKTFTGTGLTVLGMIFSNLGWAVGGPEDDDQKEKFDRLNGKQNYAIVFGDASYTFDWLAPSAIPFFMGVTMMENFAENGISVESIRDALMSITDPMIQMSMMQGLNRALDEIRYSENSGAEFGSNAMISYVLQGITNTLLSQIERGLEDKRYVTYTDKNSALSTDAQYKLGQASAKILGWDYSQVPYINAWGEEEKNPGVIANLAYNLLSPGYYSVDTTDAVYDELVRLNEAQEDVNVFPNTPKKTYDGRNLSADEYVALARTQGQKQRQIVEKMVTSVAYKTLSDTDKVKAVQRAYDYAREYAQIQVLNRDGFSAKWMSQIKGDVAAVIVQRIKDQ